MIIGTVIMLAAFGWTIYNRWITAGRTGRSLGKRITKLSLIGEPTGHDGALNTFLRDLVHILDGSVYVGYLWPLWDDKSQTFGDMLMKTIVVHAAQPPVYLIPHHRRVDHQRVDHQRCGRLGLGSEPAVTGHSPDSCRRSPATR